MLQVIFAEGLADLGRLADFSDGLDDLRGLVARFTPERVAGRTGMSADEIRDLAREFARSAPAVAYGRVGVCTQEFGGLAAWLIVALNAVTGNLDREGGSMFPLPAADLAGMASMLGERGHFGVWKSRVRGLPEFGGELPVAALAEEIETPGEGQIRALVTHAGNPVLSTPDGARVARALSSLEFMVSIDVYRNETTRHAHLILPTSVGVEREHYDLAFYALAVRNAARYVKPLVAPPPGVREDWQVLFDLAVALHGKGGGRQQRTLAWTIRGMRRLTPRRILDGMLRTGPHRISLKKLEQSPHGIDLGAHVPRLPKLLRTENKRIQLAPPRLTADVTRLEARLAGDDPNGLRLVGRRLLRSNNSWMHNSLRLVKGKEACTLLMHPDDALERGLSAGQRVRVRSRVGEIEVPLAISDEVARGVVSLPHGFGHTHDGVALEVARAHAGASVNDLTDPSLLDSLSGTASLSGVPVEVRSAVLPS
jgi:anaerobic selenocysteine-containing dehydrogenase